MHFVRKIMILNERARQAIWSMVAAFVLVLFGVADLVDQHAWLFQSAFSSRPVSHDIVFATARENLADPEFPSRRVMLAKGIDRLREAGVAHVYIDLAITKPSTRQADRELARAFAALGHRGTISHQAVVTMSGGRTLDRTLPVLSGSLAESVSIREVNYLGYGWRMPYAFDYEGRELPSMAAAIAGKSGSREDDFPIYYGFDLQSVPIVHLDDPALTSRDFARFRGKTVVIGESEVSDSAAARIPGYLRVPGSIVSIYAAESIIEGATNEVDAPYVLGIVGCLLLLISMFGASRRRRHFAYATLLGGLVVFFIATVAYAIHAYLGGALLALLWYAGLRARANWQKRFALEDDKTGLPTFRALEKSMLEGDMPPALIVARVHGAEQVAKTLSAEDYRRYVRSLVERFKVTQRDMGIYVSEGRYFAWTTGESDPSALESHLEGLRALFAAPVIVEGEEIDAGITFGIDMSGDIDAAQRIASALAAVEQSSEAHRPIAFAEVANQKDALWKISLQSRIDNALEKNEIYLVFQPKVDVELGCMTGVEALVRWDDPVRGTISPAYFIQECERAGRMEHLTRHVLDRAANASVELSLRGIDCKMSVNISATLLRDERVIRMVEQVIVNTGIDPRRLMLEITETSRIEDIKKAAQVMREISSLGVGISIDDFGVGAANLETLVHLPFDELKIDRLFVVNVDWPKPRAIIRMLVEFAREVRIDLVAEGVEDPETMQKLNNLGCNLIQGYHISRPLKFDKLVQFQWDNEDKSITNMV